MVEYTEFEQCLRRFKIVDTSLMILLDACVAPDKPLAPSLLTRYGCLELVNFLNYYNDFLGRLDKQQEKSVLCFSGFLKEIFDNKDGLTELRNNWIAHIQDDDKFSVDITDLIKNTNLPENTDDYCIMICGVNLFVQALTLLFPEEFQQTRDKFNQSQDAEIKQQHLHADLVISTIQGKISVAKKKTELSNICFPWIQFEDQLKQRPKFKLI